MKTRVASGRQRAEIMQGGYECQTAIDHLSEGFTPIEGCYRVKPVERFVQNYHGVAQSGRRA